MILTVNNVHSFLMANGLLSPEAILDGGFEATSSARRNRNVRTTSDGYGSYLIKQPEQDGDTLHSLRREVRFYQVAGELVGARRLSSLLPRFVLGDPGAGVLVLELLEDAKPLWDHYEERTAEDFPVDAAAALGRVLAVLHETFRGPVAERESALSFLPDELPPVLKLDEPSPSLLGSINVPAYRVMSMLQRDGGLAGRMKDVRALWRSETVIHGDVKLDNVLVRDPADPDRERTGDVCLVDWELVQYGDAAWDVAGALHDFIVLWIMTLPTARTVDEMLDGERFPLSAMRPASQHLWQAYVEGRQLDDAEKARVLERAVAYTAARLVQTAFELAVGSSSSMPSRTLLMLQVAANMWIDLRLAGEDLFGLTNVI